MTEDKIREMDTPEPRLEPRLPHAELKHHFQRHRCGFYFVPVPWLKSKQTA